MKAILCLSLVLGLAESAQAQTNGVRSPNEIGRLSTNTPAFEQYGVGLALSVANRMAEKWKLDIRQPLLASDVKVYLKPLAPWIEWRLNTKDERYFWECYGGCVVHFGDTKGLARRWDYKTPAKSKVSKAQAVSMACACLNALGLTEAQLRLRAPEPDQCVVLDEQGNERKVPFFDVSWSLKDDAETNHDVVLMTISGMTSNIVEYANADTNTPWIPLPTNYFQMFGLPTNYLETLSAEARRRLGLPPTPAQLAQAQALTNAIIPPEEIAAARATVREPEMWRISTNTPAFEQYGLHLMLSVANHMAKKWKLDLPYPLRVSDGKFWLKPMATSIHWGFATKRYSWDFDDGWVHLFSDGMNSPRLWHRDKAAGRALFKRMALSKSMSKTQAVSVAWAYLNALGLTEAQLRLREQPEVLERYTYTDEQGKVYPVPFFEVGWSMRDADPDRRLVTMTISGTTSNVVEYFNADPNTPRIPLPTNYFQMLGLAANYRDTIPVNYLRTYPLTYLESLSPELQRRLMSRLPTNEAETFPFKPLPPAQPTEK